MQLILWISGIAVHFYGALGNPILDNIPLYSNFLEGSSGLSSEFDTSGLLPFDSAADALEFSDDASLPLETNRLVDSLDVPVETILDIDSSGPPRQNSCGTTDPAFQPYSKRDGDICRPQQFPTEPPLVLEWPSLEKVEQSTGSNRVESPEHPLLPIFPIPGYTRVGDKENLCPMPKRRLCCLGPTFGIADNIWNMVTHCRDFGPWPCPARYDVCCQGFTNLKSTKVDFVPVGIMCYILVEDENGIVWDLVEETEFGPSKRR